MSARTVPKPAQRGVGISLIAGDETAAIVEQLQLTQPSVNITDRGVYLKADAADEIVIDLTDLSTRLARPIEVEDVLIVVASYFGEITPQRGTTPGTGFLILRADDTVDPVDTESGDRIR
ncbi:MmoB/DmpM family protein [Gordonia sp. GONU]|uniref:MmoB/DmpM family protein n=1 Tax=Gordonia sp. GONU TaxID=2972949 RepID=UPI0021AD3113|nr:MmoB/DmpM family protein [Gordonia sp. GONU]MCR8896831.1 MmoB/DmpM family protein [Gordonia sp. GONU]